MPKFHFAAFLLVGMTELSLGENAALRGLQAANDGYNEKLGTCRGATCGGWGDPHMITCDRVEYDCQGTGIYTLMDNFMFDMQGTFVSVMEKELHTVRNEFPYGATYANDIMIRYKDQEGEDDTGTGGSNTLQFSFGDISHHYNGLGHLADTGCMLKKFYKNDLAGVARPGPQENVHECRKRCAEVDTCNAFTYFANKKCHLADSNVQLLKDSSVGWTSVVAGTMDSNCGTEDPAERDPTTPEQREKMTKINKGCPLLMFVDGEMMDLSWVDNAKETLFETDDKFIKVTLMQNNTIEIDYKTSRLTDSDWLGNDAKIRLRRSGSGPGEMWGCHWEYWICLPKAFKDDFVKTTLGLMGVPDGDKTNDWTDRDGNPLEIFNAKDEDLEMLEYCVDNWCVDYEKSLMIFHGDKTYADYGCPNPEEPHTVEECLVSKAAMHEACGGLDFHLIRQCEIDCCAGGCEKPQIDIEVYGEEDDLEIVFSCEETTFEDTSDEVCPGTDVVTLIKTEGTQSLPGDSPIFYGIVVDSEPTGEVGLDTVHFKVNNPFASSADVYVKYDTPFRGFLDPKCDLFEDKSAGCGEAVDIEVGCHEFDGQTPFALVEVFFASTEISTDDSATVNKCCKPLDYDASVGVVSYTFEILCECPATTG